jgi:predicted ferric reductase
VLISVLPSVEAWFDGIDHAAIWHRRFALVGLLLVVVPHTLLSVGKGQGKVLGGLGMAGLIALALWAVLPRWRAMLSWTRRSRTAFPARKPCVTTGRLRVWTRKVFGGYERWRLMQKLTGLFLAAGVVHGYMDGSAFHSPVLRWTYLGISGTGLAVYVYRETIARFFVPMHDYQVSSVSVIGPGTTELALKPLGRPMTFIPGQFAMLYMEGKSGWRRHPSRCQGPPTTESCDSPSRRSATTPASFRTSSSPACRLSSADPTAGSSTPAAPATKSGSLAGSVSRHF